MRILHWLLERVVVTGIFTGALVRHPIQRPREIVCRLRGGHYKVKVVEQERLFERCLDCHKESPGWAITKTRPITARLVALDSD